MKKSEGGSGKNGGANGNGNGSGSNGKHVRDLRRFAAVDTETNEVLEVGMNLNEGESYVASYNQVMFRTGRSVRLVQIAWELSGDVASRVQLAGNLN